MQLRLPATSIVALGLVGCASAANLRNRNTNRKLTKSSECIIEVAELLEIEPGTIDSTIFGKCYICFVSISIFVPFDYIMDT